MKASLDNLKKQVEKNCRITRDKLLKEDKDKGISFFRGKYDHLSATIQVVSVSNVIDIDTTVKSLGRLTTIPTFVYFTGGRLTMTNTGLRLKKRGYHWPNTSM